MSDRNIFRQRVSANWLLFFWFAWSPSYALDLEGTLLFDIPNFNNQQVTVVYLVPKQQDMTFPVPANAKLITQNDATFKPKFLVVSIDQIVDMPNMDDILHNVFSYSPGNQFDLGLYRNGESRSVTFQKAGLVRIYCSIHRSMRGSIFVVTSPLWSLVSPESQWTIHDVPYGEYTLKTYSNGLPSLEREIKVDEHTTPMRLIIGLDS